MLEDRQSIALAMDWKRKLQRYLQYTCLIKLQTLLIETYVDKKINNNDKIPQRHIFSKIKKLIIMLKFRSATFFQKLVKKLQCKTELKPWSRSRIHKRTISLRFLGIILRVLRFEVSVCNVYITNQFQTTLLKGWGGGSKSVKEVTVISNEGNS